MYIFAWVDMFMLIYVFLVQNYNFLRNFQNLIVLIIFAVQEM